ncbi:class I SAM-dependent methyltransferase [Clostridium sediminicola]|uniref:class I SAM-dependent methyltransferase n=1 Tax=Clostridium sediminicola TaxID=3114879 RepID=UPI0031F25BAC
MNYSNFIEILKNDYGVDFNEVWKKAIHCKGERNRSRGFFDEVEAEFWKDYSEKYDKNPSLYDYAPHTFDKLLSIVGENKTLLEFGCGTGKFTLPMSHKSEKIIAVDFSEHMLEKISNKLKANKIDNVVLLHSKFEDIDIDKVDSIYCINANYRIINIESALKKMNNMAKENVVIVWTMQRNIYDDILNKTVKKGIERCQEYIHLVNILYEIGIDPNVEILDVNKPIEIQDIHENYKEIKTLCEQYQLPYDFVKKEFDNCIYYKDNQAIYNCKLKVVYIHFEPCFLY